MGFVDVSELIEPLTDKDREYVKEHLSGATDWRRDWQLLDKDRTNRRTLAPYYAVEEPDLLKVLMAEYRDFSRIARDQWQRGEIEAGSGVWLLKHSD
jgi:hypothetical protein